MKTVKYLLLRSGLKRVHDDGAQVAHMTRRGLQVAQRVQSERTLSMAQALSALTLNHLHLLGGVTVEKFVPTEDGAVAVGRQRLDDQTPLASACMLVGGRAGDHVAQQDTGAFNRRIQRWCTVGGGARDGSALDKMRWRAGRSDSPRQSRNLRLRMSTTHWK